MLLQSQFLLRTYFELLEMVSQEVLADGWMFHARKKPNTLSYCLLWKYWESFGGGGGCESCKLFGAETCFFYCAWTVVHA